MNAQQPKRLAQFFDTKQIVSGVVVLIIGALLGWSLSTISDIDADIVASKLAGNSGFQNRVARLSAEVPVGAIIPFEQNECPKDNPKWRKYENAEGRFAVGANAERAAGSRSDFTAFALTPSHLPITFKRDDHGSGPGTLYVVTSTPEQDPEELQPPYFALTWCEKVL